MSPTGLAKRVMVFGVLLLSFREHVRRIWRPMQGLAVRVFWQRESFYAMRCTSLDSSSTPVSDYVRWVDQVDVGESVKLGLFMHPVSSKTFTVRVPRGGRIRASIALFPQVWDKNRGGVLFQVSVAPVGTSPYIWVEQFINPREDPRHRRWKTVDINLSPLSGRDVEVRFATDLPPRVSPEYAWAVWGDPELIRRKPLGGVLLRQVEAVRRYGLRNTLRRYRAILARAGEAGTFYTLWLKQKGYGEADVDRLLKEGAKFNCQPRISLITPIFNTDPKWLRECVESVRKQVYPHWELCLCDDGSFNPETKRLLDQLEGSDSRIKVARLVKNQGISVASNRALNMATGEFIGLLDHDDQLTQDALHEVVKCLNAHPDADLLYSDEDKLEPDGSPSEPFFKPDWSPEYLRSTMYIGHLAVYRRKVVDAVGGFRREFDGSQDYDLALRVTERTDRIFHIPRILYHWRKTLASAARSIESKPWAVAAGHRALAAHVARLGFVADVDDLPARGFWRVRRCILNDPLVTIIIPTDGRIVPTAKGPKDLLLNCVRSVVERTAYKRYELIVVDNGHVSSEAQSYLAGVEHHRVSFPYTQPFNFSAKINFSARHARGDHLLLLNDDTEVIGDEWLSAMLEFSQQREVGVVGAKLYYPDERIQHMGVVLGIGGGACHVFCGQPKNHPGYFGSAWIVRNYSAVTGACLMTRRLVFDEVGGFDERLATDFNDVDYCLRVRAQGYRVVFTPFAELYHYEGATFGSRESKVNLSEIQLMEKRWLEMIEDDPYYNPNLTRSSLDYELRI